MKNKPINSVLAVFIHFALSQHSHYCSVSNLHWTRSPVHARKDSFKVCTHYLFFGI